jgi:Arc/MetJ family transcription regulator
MRTNIVLDEKLVSEAITLTGVRSKRELIDLALQELIRSRRKKSLFDLADDYDHKQLRELRHDTDCTSIWINIFRDKSQRYSQRFYDFIGEQDIVLTRFQQLELLQGCRDEREWG